MAVMIQGSPFQASTFSRRLRPLLALLSFAIAAYSPAADPVEELVRSALANNPKIRAQRAKILAAEQVIPRSAALPDPVAEVEFMNLSVRDPKLKEGLTEGISAGVTQMLPYPGKRAVARAMAEREAAMERAKLRALEAETTGQVRAAAYSLWMLLRLLELNAQTQEALDAAAKGATALYSSGMGNQAEVIFAQAAATRQLARREELELQKGVSLSRLESLLAAPAAKETLDGLDLPEPGPLCSLEDLLKALPESAPEVSMGRAEEEVRRAAVEMAKLEFKPDFMVGGRYRYKDMSMGGGDYVTAMFGVTLPFFHRKDRYLPALQEATLRREAAGMETEGRLLEARFELSRSYQQAERSLRLFRLYKDGLLIQARQAYESSLAAYGVGQIDFASLLMALTELYDAQADIVMAQAGYHEASAMIDAVLDRPYPQSSEEKTATPTHVPPLSEETEP